MITYLFDSVPIDKIVPILSFSCLITETIENSSLVCKSLKAFLVVLELTVNNRFVPVK